MGTDIRELFGRASDEFGRRVVRIDTRTGN